MDIKTFIKQNNINTNIKYNHEIDFVSDYHSNMKENGIFIAIKGKNQNGELFINDAIIKGARTIITRHLPFKKQKKINYILTDYPLKILNLLMKMEIENSNITFIAITGTTGKSSVSYLLYDYLKSLAYDVALFGTNWIYDYYGLKEEQQDSNNTTPSQAIIYQTLKKHDFNYDYVIMEVSSQGINEGRVLGIPFKIISITNLSYEHHEYHHSYSEYKMTKAKLVECTNQQNLDTTVIVNHDDENSTYFKDITLYKVLEFGFNTNQTKVINLQLGLTNTRFTLIDNNQKYDINTNLIGKFNVYNILNLWQINKSLGIKNKSLITYLQKIITIPGRMNLFEINDRYVVVDYAHTIKAVEEVLKCFHKLKKNNKLIAIMGCGGNRDNLKRPLYGGLLTKYSDYVYFTEDNSRNENPYLIINEMIKGVIKNNYEVIVNRKEAIYKAFNNSNKADFILILGKGIEKYLIRNNEKISYCDLDIIKELKNDN